MQRALVGERGVHRDLHPWGDVTSARGLLLPWGSAPLSRLNLRLQPEPPAQTSTKPGFFSEILRKS